MTLFSCPGISNSIVPVSANWRINWTLPTFRGNPYKTISAINVAGGIVTSRTSGEVPFFFQASGSAVTATGTDRPYEDLEYAWTLTFNDDSAITDEEGLSNYNSRATKNQNTDQIEPEAVFVIRAPGTYKLTMDVRGTDGVGGFTTASTTATITVSAYSSAHIWIDKGAGNDANDGLDPWGFAITSGTYTDSTKTITKTGAFSSYNHTTATAAANITLRYNYIYLTGGTGITPGLYEIASKTDADNIILTSSAGSNSSTLTSSDGPEASFTGPTTDQWVHFTGDFLFTSRPFSINDEGHIRLTGYGSSASMTADTGYSNNEIIYVVASGSTESNAVDIVFAGFTIDAADQSTRAYYILVGCSGGGLYKQIYADNMSILEGLEGNVAQRWTGTCTLGEVGWWKCIIQRNDTSDNSTVYVRPDADYYFFVGCEVDARLASSGLDHHIYCAGIANHRLFAWNAFGINSPVTGTGSASLNHNCGNITEPDVNYCVIAENYFVANGVHVIMDTGSNTNNNRTDALFNNVIVSANGAKGGHDQMMWGKSHQDITIRFNAFAGASNVEYILDFDSAADIQLYDNLFYGERYKLGASQRNNALFAKGNVHHAPHTVARFWELDYTNPGSATITIDDNTYWYPNDTDDDVFKDLSDSTWGDLADWKATGLGGSGEANTDPTWNDPENGDFG